MTIAIAQFEGLGARTYLPEGPYGVAGQTPLPSYKVGSVVGGDNESEFTFLLLPVISSLTLNQGDVLVWDNSYMASQSNTGAGIHPFGGDVGTFYLGGRVADVAAAPAAGNYWSYTFTPGVYGIWVQRAGTSVMNIATVNAQSKPMNTTAVLGQVNQPAAALVGSMGVTGAWSAPTSYTFTATTVIGSTTLTVVNKNIGLVKGMTLSGTGIPVGAVILDIQGPTVTMSLAATAAGAGVTITAANNSTFVTTTNGSAVLTNVTSIAGLYPNQTIAGTGIPASTTILSITGNAAPYSITMSANATATANNINATTTVYVEAFLRWPYIGVQN